MTETVDPDPDHEPRTDMDPAELKQALGRTGRMLKTAGLPFEADEFEDEEDASSADAPTTKPTDPEPL